MLVYHEPIENNSFKPFMLKISIETEQEYNDLYRIFSFYGTIPKWCKTINDDERDDRTSRLLMKIYDELHEAGVK